MALDDLDLEFEDEEEAKKKKNDAVQVDVDLEFQAPEGGGKPRPVVRPAAPGSQASARPAAKPGEVRKIDEARTVSPPKRPGPPVSHGSSALKLDADEDLDHMEVVETRSRIAQVEFEASVKVATAEYKAELLSDVLSDAKLLDHRISQLMARIVSKHPETKQEALMIKKLLAEFISKKRK